MSAVVCENSQWRKLRPRRRTVEAKSNDMTQRQQLMPLSWSAARTRRWFSIDECRYGNRHRTDNDNPSFKYEAEWPGGISQCHILEPHNSRLRKCNDQHCRRAEPMNTHWPDRSDKYQRKDRQAYKHDPRNRRQALPDGISNSSWKICRSRESASLTADWLILSATAAWLTF